jgi:hypothetical protein
MKAVAFGASLALLATGAHAQFIDWGAAESVNRAQAQQNANNASQLEQIQRLRALNVLRGVDWNNPESVSSAINALRGLGMFDQAAQLEQMQRQRAEAQQQQQGADIRADRARRVGSLVATGDCDAAKNLALSEGDFDMAQRAVALCTPKAASPQP